MLQQRVNTPCCSPLYLAFDLRGSIFSYTVETMCIYTQPFIRTSFLVNAELLLRTAVDITNI